MAKHARLARTLFHVDKAAPCNIQKIANFNTGTRDLIDLNQFLIQKKIIRLLCNFGVVRLFRLVRDLLLPHPAASSINFLLQRSQFLVGLSTEFRELSVSRFFKGLANAIPIAFIQSVTLALADKRPYKSIMYIPILKWRILVLAVGCNRVFL